MPYADPERQRAYFRDYNAKRTAESRRTDRLWSSYRLRPEDFDLLVASQESRCAICRDETTDWHVDHDHGCCPGRNSCGACVRGLLCRNCNHGLGNFQDRPEVALAAAAYLANWQEKKAA